MNKKVALSVLSATVFASMAASAFAAPKSGLYIGGEVDKFYSFDTLFDATDATMTQFTNEIGSAGFSNLIYVDFDGKGASLQEIMDSTDFNSVKKDLTADKFEGEYANIKADGSEDGKYDPRKDAIDTPTGDLKVESVSAINSKQFTIEFSKAVDKASLINGTTFATNTVTLARTVADATDADKNAVHTGATVELSEDGKTATVTVAGATYLDGSYTVTVSDNVKDTDGKAVVPFSTVINADDNTAPTVKEVKYIKASNKVSVQFSEPLENAPSTVRLNGQPVTIDAFTSGDTVTFTNTAASGTTAALYVAGATDFAGNDQPAYSGNVTVDANTNPLAVTSIAQVDSNVVRVVFDKAVAGATAAAAQTDVADSLTVLKAGAAIAPGAITVTRVADDTNNKTFDVAIDVGAAGGPDYGIYGTASTASLTFLLADQGVTDIYGNKNGAYSETVTLTKDATGPAFVSAKLAQDKKSLEVTFDEKLLAGSVNDAKVVVRNNGVNATVAAATDIKAGTGNEKVLSIVLGGTDVNGDGTIKAGSYTVRLEAEAVQDEHENKSALITVPAVAVDGATAGDLTVTIADVNVTTDPNEYLVTFSGAVNETALNAANYKLDGAALPAGTDVYFDDSTKTKVHIALPTGSVNIGKVGTGANAILTVSNVKDADGRTVVTKNGTVKVVDNTAATLTGATLNGDVLTLTFNENLDDASLASNDLAGILADFTIKAGTTAFAEADVDPATDADGDGTADEAASAVVSVSGTKVYVTITGNESNWSQVKAANTITVETTGTNLEDANDVTVAANKVVTVVKQ